MAADGGVHPCISSTKIVILIPPKQLGKKKF